MRVNGFPLSQLRQWRCGNLFCYTALGSRLLKTAPMKPSDLLSKPGLLKDVRCLFINFGKTKKGLLNNFRRIVIHGVGVDDEEEIPPT